jgi:hypothetical protein
MRCGDCSIPVRCCRLTHTLRGQYLLSLIREKSRKGTTFFLNVQIIVRFFWFLYHFAQVSYLNCPILFNKNNKNKENKMKILKTFF